MFSLLRVLVIVGVILFVIYWLYKLTLSFVSKRKKRTIKDVDNKINEAIDELNELQKEVKQDESEAEKILEHSKKTEEEIKKRKEFLN